MPRRQHQQACSLKVILPAVDLRVHRMLDPERAVLAEFGDGRRHEIRAARVVVARTNLLILLRWRIVHDGRTSAEACAFAAVVTTSSDRSEGGDRRSARGPRAG